VIDFETTGLSPEGDRVIEVSVARFDPGALAPLLVFDSLVNPQQAVQATEVHGITDRMVKNAPTFRELWPALQDALSDCVVAAYNAYFDMRFLAAEAGRAKSQANVPFMCLKSVRTSIRVGKGCSLAEACRLHQIKFSNAHSSAGDAVAAALLVPHYLNAMNGLGVHTFRDLMGRAKHRYTESFVYHPFAAPSRACSHPLLPRTPSGSHR